MAAYYEYQYSFGIGRQITKVVRALLIANISVFIAELVLKHAVSPAAIGWVERHLAISDIFISGLHLWQPLTYMFLHAPDSPFHILFNMLFLYWFGCDIEARYGSRTFLFVYLSAGIFAGVCQWAACALGGQPFAIIGASGAITAVLVAYAAHFPERRIFFFLIFPMPVRWAVLLIVGMDFYSTLSASNGYVATVAHLGGAAYGFAWAVVSPAARRWLRDFQRHAGERRERLNAAQAARLDQLLAKVHGRGMQSLSWREKRFLRRISQNRR